MQAINLVFDHKLKRGPITYRHGGIARTDYTDESFDAITCLSVVEHGVNLDSYFKEMWRILKPGGLLVTSTDYWQTPTETGGRLFYGAPIHIFTKQELLAALHIALLNGFVSTGPLDLSCNQKAVHWSEVNLDYTFVVFTMQKPPKLA